MAETIKIGGELESMATGKIVAAASAIRDYDLNKSQSELNAFIQETKQAVDELSPDQSEALALATDVVNLKDDVAQGAVFDVSAKFPTSGVEGGNTYTLEGALAVLDTNLSADKKKGGMSIKFVQSSDNKYAQYRLMADTFSTIEADWQGVDSEIKAGSKNLADSGAVSDSINSVIGTMADKSVSATGTASTRTFIYLKDGIKYIIYVQCSTAVTHFNTGIWVYNGSQFTQIATLTAEQYSDGYEFEYTPDENVELIVRPYNTGTVKVKVWDESGNVTLNRLDNELSNETERVESMLNGTSVINHNGSYIDNNADEIHNSGWSYFKIGVNTGDKVMFTASNGGSSANNTCILIPNDGSETIIVANGSKTNFEYVATKDGLLYVNNIISQQSSPYLKVVSKLEDKVTSSDIKNAIASEAFTYSNITKTNEVVTSANIVWPDGATGAMSITYTSGLPTQIDYTHILNGVTRSFRQTITYSNGEIASNTIIEL